MRDGEVSGGLGPTEGEGGPPFPIAWVRRYVAVTRHAHE